MAGTAGTFAAGAAARRRSGKGPVDPAHPERGHLLLHIRGRTLRAVYRFIAEDELLEILSALVAAVFIDRHLSSFIR
jgi:hypothetical protein